MSDLPSGVYTSYGMTTSLKTVIIAAFGQQYGDYKHRATNLLAAVSTPRIVNHSLRTGNLPSNSYASFLMSTSTKTVVLSYGYGQYGRVYQLILTINQLITPSCRVIGNLKTLISLPLPPGCIVQGNISLLFHSMLGMSAVLGAATCKGNVQTRFTPTVPGKATLLGNVNVRFLLRGGQQSSCITGPDSPDLGAGTPKNFVY